MQINLQRDTNTMPTLKLSLLLTSSTYKSILPKSPNTTLLLLLPTTTHPIPIPIPIRTPPIRCTLPTPPPPPPNPLVCYYYNNNKRVQFRGDRYTRIDRYIERVVCFSSSSSSSSEMGFETPPPTPEKQQRQQTEKLMTLPTILTIGRVLSVPLLVATFYVDSWWGTTSTTSIFIIAAITDWLDGYIARKMRLGSAFGAFLDPVADKLMVAATLILLCTRPFEVPGFGQVPWVLTVPAIAIIGREITMSAVREWAASQNGKLSEAVAVNNLGKWKTATQMTALIILLATRDSSLAQSGTLVGSGVVLLYVSAWLSIWSLVVYMRKIWKVLLK